MTEIEQFDTQNAKKIGREDLLKTSSWLVETLQGRLSKPRFVVYNGDPLKLQFFRVLIQAIQTHNAILRDEELEDIKAHLELIDAALGVEKKK